MDVSNFDIFLNTLLRENIREKENKFIVSLKDKNIYKLINEKLILTYGETFFFSIKVFIHSKPFNFIV